MGSGDGGTTEVGDQRRRWSVGRGSQRQRPVAVGTSGEGEMEGRRTGRVAAAFRDVGLVLGFYIYNSLNLLIN